MVHASHVVIGAYGFWLPNDPRGSWSDFVRQWELFRFGPATKVETRASVAAKPHDRDLRQATKKALTYPPVVFSGVQARAIGMGFGSFVEKSGVKIWACSILPEHIHLVIGRHRYRVESIVNHLKGQATRELISQGIHPLAAWQADAKRPPRCFGSHEWKVFLDSDEDIRRSIGYVEGNPEKEGKLRQSWSFVTEYPGLGW